MSVLQLYKVGTQFVVSSCLVSRLVCTYLAAHSCTGQLHVIIDYNSINNYRTTNRFPRALLAGAAAEVVVGLVAQNRENGTQFTCSLRLYELAEINCPD